MNRTNVVGLDLSLASTGIARIDGTTITQRPRPATMRGGERLEWHRDRLTHAILGGTATSHGHPGLVDLVVIEDYAPGAIGISGKLANAGLRGVTELLCWQCNVGQVAFIKPGTLKRWATGNGAAKKPAMIAAARDAGWVGDDKADDEADAFHLRTLGLQYLTGQGPPEQIDVCDTIAWPT